MTNNNFLVQDASVRTEQKVLQQCINIAISSISFSHAKTKCNGIYKQNRVIDFAVTVFQNSSASPMAKLFVAEKAECEDTAIHHGVKLGSITGQRYVPTRTLGRYNQMTAQAKRAIRSMVRHSGIFCGKGLFTINEIQHDLESPENLKLCAKVAGVGSVDDLDDSHLGKMEEAIERAVAKLASNNGIAKAITELNASSMPGVATELRELVMLSKSYSALKRKS
jgi:hypothetical protein